MRLIIPYETFVTFSTIKDFKDNSKSISFKDAIDINKFIQLGFSREKPPYFRFLPIIGEVSHSSQFRFMLIDVDGSIVCIFYKSVTLFHNQQVRVFGLPISEDGNEVASTTVFEHLKSLPITKFLITNEKELPLFESVEEPEGYSDYYYDFDIHSVLNSKYVHHHKVHKVINNPDFKVVVYSGRVMADINSLVAVWGEWCNGLLYYVTDKRRANEYKNLLLCEDRNLFKTVIYYKGKPVSVRIWYYYEPLDICRSFYNVHCARTCDIEIYPIMKHITHIQKYIMADYIKHNIQTNLVFIAGAGPDCEFCKLRKHKQEISQGCVEYHLCK